MVVKKKKKRKREGGKKKATASLSRNYAEQNCESRSDPSPVKSIKGCGISARSGPPIGNFDNLTRPIRFPASSGGPLREERANRDVLRNKIAQKNGRLFHTREHANVPNVRGMRLETDCTWMWNFFETDRGFYGLGYLRFKDFNRWRKSVIKERNLNGIFIYSFVFFFFFFFFLFYL